MIDVVGEDGTPQRLVAVHRDPAKQAFLQELRRRYPTDVAAPHGYAKVIRTGESELLTNISDAVLEAVAKDAEQLKMLRELGFTSNLCVPLIAREHILGAITLAMAESGRRFDAADLALAEEVARRAALALDNARLYLEAQDAIQMRDDFVSIASHELKTPVTSLLGYSQTLLRRATKQRPYTFTERDEKALQVIVEQTRRLHTQIDALLDIGRLQRGAFSTNRQPMNICDLVEQVVDEFKPLLDHHMIELICDEGGLIVDGDKDRLEQVLQNLLQNAVKYSPDGGRITVQVDQQDTQVCISVSDQGLGIPAAAQSLVFQPFYRAPMQGQPMIQGTGIGLYVVKEIVTLHSGTIELESAEGQGSTFRVRLPLVAPVSPAKSA